MTDRIIDSHTHAWTTEDAFTWEASGPRGAEKIVYSVENVREDMEAMDIEQACLVATPIHGTGSPYTRECLRRYPDDFYGVLWLDYVADDIAYQVDDALAIESVIGFRIYATEEDERFKNDALDPFWEALQGWSEPQVQFLLTPGLLEMAESIVAAHPGVNFVFDHIAQPEPAVHRVDEPPYNVMAEIAEHPNAFVKITHTSSMTVYPFEDLHQYIIYLLDEFGSDRLLWGSDFIYHFKRATPWETLHFLEEAEFLSRNDRRDLLYRTFESMLP